MLASALRTKLTQSIKWTPVLFPQDTPHILNLAQFFTQALTLLLPPQDPALKRVLEEKFPGARRGKALDLLQHTSRSQGRSLVLVVDNLDVFLNEQLPAQDAKILGQILAFEPWLSIVGTINSRNLPDFPPALKEFFKIQAIGPLTGGEMARLWKNITGYPPSSLAKGLCSCLCRGNPRLIAFLADAFNHSKSGSLTEAFFTALDCHTPYYKGQMQVLPAVERKVFAILADQWAPSTARDIAEMADMDVNKASSLLNRLVRRGRVQVVSKQGRVKWYELEGPFNNLNFLMRTGLENKKRILGLCRFMEALYQEHVDREHEGINRSSPDFTQTRESPQPPSSSATDPPSMPQPEKEPPPGSLPLSLPAFTINQPSSQPASDPTDAAGWIELAKTLESEGLCEDAVRAYKKSLDIQPNHAWAWGRLGQLLRTELHLYPEAENAYLQAIEHDPNQAWIWSGLGQLLHENQRNYVEAEQAYRIAIELAPRSSEHRVCMGRLHEKLDRHQSAIRTYQEAASMEPDNPLPYKALGDIFESQGKTGEAEQAYIKGTECRPSNAKGWAIIGHLLEHRLQAEDEAKNAYQKALQHDPSCYAAWEGLIHMELKAFNNPDNALAMARSYLDDRGHSPMACKNLTKTFSRESLKDLLPEILALSGHAHIGGFQEPAPSLPSETIALPIETHSHPATELGYSPKNSNLDPKAPTAISPAQNHHTGPEALMETLESLSMQTEPSREALTRIINAALTMSATGQGEDAAQFIAQSGAFTHLLPLWAGIQVYLGQEVQVAMEIREVSQEVVKRIRLLKNLDIH
ncbi:MAG: tetratricopeptide repeat protein [Desulfatibacillum sp.]|nr:tetratricopeptide repeat protein [Desulfatibacillum sp.]